MGQEDAENKISFECLRTMVDNAIKTKNICMVETIENENQLRYMQKYAELLVSQEGLAISYPSIKLGILSVGLALFAIGLSYILVDPTGYLNKQILFFGGILIVIIAFVIFFLMLRTGKVIKNKNDDVEFIYKIILKIQEKLSDSTQKPSGANSMKLNDLVNDCEKPMEWRNLAYWTLHSFSGNFEFYRVIVDNKIEDEEDITKFIEICDNRIERAKVLLSDVATVLGFLITGTAILASFAKENLILFLGAIIIILGFALLFHYRANVHAWTAFKEAAILIKNKHEIFK